MSTLSEFFRNAFLELYDHSGKPEDYPVQPCSQEFNADYTFVLFPWAKRLQLKPEELGLAVGNHLQKNQHIHSFEIVKGFLNFTLEPEYWIGQNRMLFECSLPDMLKDPEAKHSYLIEYCSPNTNKPLHLGHIRNILLGWSVYQILKAVGHPVETTQVINDRGVAICKSMLAWKLFGNGQTPDEAGIKPDHFVGDYYVLFDQKLKQEYDQWQQSGEGRSVFLAHQKEGESDAIFFGRYKNEYFNRHSELGKAVRSMLLKWEQQDPEIIQLWKMMNDWVYAGFEKTFEKLGIHFDHYYYESNTYLLGKDIARQGLEKGIFYKEQDGSVWVNLEDKGLDRKIILRSDGTSVYITQDLGTAQLRHRNHKADRYIYVVADEQDYHFKVLFETLKKLDEPYAEGLYHLSYGMVDLPHGRMKSREGTVVDADDLIQDVIDEARKTAEERGEIANTVPEELHLIYERIGLAALKYFILKVAPKKRMIFDPKESVDMQGHTGPYIANAYVRIKSILRKSECSDPAAVPEHVTASERNLIKTAVQYKGIVQEAGRTLDPSHLANYLYALAKDYHKYYHDIRILNAETESLKQWRLMLSSNVSKVLHHGMGLLGIQLPEKM